MTSFSRLRSLRRPVMTPASTRSTTLSVNISVWTPRSRWSCSARAVAAGMAPMPSWMVAPSATSSATYWPIRCSTSPSGADGMLVGWDVDLDARSMSSTWTKPSPSVRGMRPVELRDDDRRGRARRVDGLDRDAQRTEAVRVGRRDVEQHGIERHGAAAEQPRHVGQEGRDVVGATLGHGGPGVRPDEQGAMPEVAGHLRREVGTRPFRVEVDHPDVAQRRLRERRARRAGPTARPPPHGRRPGHPIRYPRRPRPGSTIRIVSDGGPIDQRSTVQPAAGRSPASGGVDSRSRGRQAGPVDGCGDERALEGHAGRRPGRSRRRGRASRTRGSARAPNADSGSDRAAIEAVDTGGRRPAIEVVMMAWRVIDPDDGFAVVADAGRVSMVASLCCPKDAVRSADGPVGPRAGRMARTVARAARPVRLTRREPLEEVVMEPAVAGQDRARIDVATAVEVGHPTAGLLDDARSARQRPRASARPRPSPRPRPRPAGCSPRSRRTRARARPRRAGPRSPGPAGVRRGPGRCRTGPGASASAPTRLTAIRRGVVVAPVARPGPTAAVRPPALVEGRRGDDRGLQLAIALDRQEGAEEGHAAHEVVGAVDRVDVPAHAGLAGLRRRTPRRPGHGRGRPPVIRSRMRASMAVSASVTNVRSGLVSMCRSRRKWPRAMTSASSQAAWATSSQPRSSASVPSRRSAEGTTGVARHGPERSG